MITYVLAIRRGFKDKTFGIPIAALAANISWEAIYGFVFRPTSDFMHDLSIFWFFFDIPIAVQCFLYGPKDFSTPFVRRHFRLIFVATLVMAFLLVLVALHDLRDLEGNYTGYGMNFMMSILFIAMLARRDDVRGQSVYIGIFKWFGTFIGYIATVVEVTTNLEHPWPSEATLKAMYAHKSYPLTPVMSLMYLFTFALDILYIFLVYRKSKEQNIDPWKRF